MPQTPQSPVPDSSFQEELETLYPFLPQRFGCYGDLHVVSEYLGFEAPPCGLNGEWQHGHIEPGRNTDPDFVIGSDGMSRLKMNSRYFVAREDQREYLTSMGYTDVHNIGLPFIYVTPPAVERMENSLLVMPFHTIGGMDVDHRKLEEQYMGYIDSIRGRFGKVVCCLHRNDYDKGDWKRHFNERGMETVVGGDPNDANSILRMAYLFSKFDFVTGNSWGSHLAYGAYFGAKVSIAGPKPEIHRETFEKLTYYKNKPRLLDLVVDGSMTEKRKAVYPFLWSDPWLATPQQGWAKWQLGESSLRSPDELQRLFQWPNRSEQIARKLVLRLKSAAPRFLRRLPRILCRRRKTHDPLNPEETVLLRNIGASYAEDPDHLNVFGCAQADFPIGLRLRKNSSDTRVYKQVIGEQEYHPPLSLLEEGGREPRWIVDCGANIGITSLYFRNRFPRCSLICIEADGDNFTQLQFNLQEQDNVHCHHRAVWHEGNIALNIGNDYRDGKEWARRVGDNASEDIGKQVKSITIREIIEEHDIDVIDFLKIDVEGAEQEIFLSGTPSEFLEKTRLIAIEIHEDIADRERIQNLLKNSGFTIFRSVELTIGINRRLCSHG